MQQRLIAIGLRPISALVDVTNYMTFDQGRPMHVFDADKVKGDLVVRRALEGEEILALDTRTYKLNPANVVIADENGLESIGGVMGGEHSGCDETTTNVLIEIRTLGPDQYRQDRPQPFDHHRCPLSLRARRRPRIHAARP